LALKSSTIFLIKVVLFRSNISLKSNIVELVSRYVLVFGNEVYELSQEAVDICDDGIEIPQLGTKHSLNLLLRAVIVVWDLFQKNEMEFVALLLIDCALFFSTIL
jgi:tRNA(Leu) C34 or U34 (ribose-2'-O)-methylase TrmL